MLKVLLVDDHPLIRVGLRDAVRAAFDNVTVGEASDGFHALQLARLQRWDVVVLDAHLPGLDGVETLARLRIEHAHLHVIMLSAPTPDCAVGLCLKTGAAGYVSKTHAGDELVEALETVLSGGVYVSPALAAYLGTSDEGACCGGTQGHLPEGRGEPAGGPLWAGGQPARG